MVMKVVMTAAAVTMRTVMMSSWLLGAWPLCFLVFVVWESKFVT